MSCVRKGGVCILEDSSLREPRAANELDPFGASILLMAYLISTWGNGKYGVRQLLTAPTKRDSVNHLYFIVIQSC